MAVSAVTCIEKHRNILLTKKIWLPYSQIIDDIMCVTFSILLVYVLAHLCK